MNAPRLRHLLALPGHRLQLEFSDGTHGEVDLSNRLFGPMFLPLKDEAVFAQVRLDEFGAPSWPSGADLAPDALYLVLRGEPGEKSRIPSTRLK